MTNHFTQLLLLSLVVGLVTSSILVAPDSHKCYHYERSLIELYDGNLYRLDGYGTLIHPKWAISTARSFENYTTETQIIVLGPGIFAYTHEYLVVEKVFIDPGYNATTVVNDFSLMLFYGSFPKSGFYRGFADNELFNLFYNSKIAATLEHPVKNLFNSRCEKVKRSDKSCTEARPTLAWVCVAEIDTTKMPDRDVRVDGAPVLIGNYIIGILSKNRGQLDQVGRYTLFIKNGLRFYQDTVEQNGYKWVDITVEQKYKCHYIKNSSNPIILRTNFFIIIIVFKVLSLVL